MFFEYCWEVLLKIATYSPLLDSSSYTSQQPFVVPQNAHDNNELAPLAGPSFKVAGTNFVCNYPRMNGYRSCNSAKGRDCWLRSSDAKNITYDIHTEYDTPGDNFTPTGVIREYWLDVDLQPIAPDGYLKSLGQVFNGTYPGPHLEGCWGDTFVVHVTNKIPNLGTTIHWHGIRQLHTNQQDGVNGVTQCPIAYNETYTYRFHAQQYGHTWYHSHYQTQYSDGVAGPLTIYGPSSDDWDETFTPVMMQDWVHENTSVAFKQELAQAIPIADSLLLGGVNQFKCSSLDPKCCVGCNRATCNINEGENPEFCCTPDPGCFKTVNGVKTIQGGGRFNKTFEEGKRYLLQLINASSESMFIFAIDDHDLQVIQADLVPIVPYTTDSVFVAIGQRYQVIVTAKPKKKSRLCVQDVRSCNYWIRTRIASGCGTVAQDNEETGIIQYSPNRSGNPETISGNDREACQDEPVDKLRPVVRWNAADLRNNRDNYTFDAAFDNVTNHGAFRWELSEKPLFLNYSDPSILNVNDASFFADPNVAAVNYTNHAWNDGFVYLVITAGNVLNIPGKRGVPAAHPIHLHGHDFVILAQIDRQWDGTVPAMNTDNPTRRDTALLYAGGYLALAFKLDNPGIWLVHCHIAWHASSGLALNIIERQDEIVGSIGSLDATRDTCAGWERMNLKFEQEDSGI
ncbi:Laccase-2 [Cercospora beticola]|uniref:Laccase-2 n=1 Tax=Cercospora beticola TaxID=122368 RepID=A0A2G5HCL9_CERBT|nr:Laccase-2 [Cercospora beticola]PIA90290.1 Laccase-2 [Cercospora beticola]WPB08012.1 hypothetical protein RHO25_012676 [Cercospora beticola]CAK1368130.1 unnamed protein product [Cercospora beticola]